MDETQEPAGVDGDRVFLVVDPRKTLSAVQCGDMLIDVVGERLVSNPWKAITDILELRPSGKMQRQENSIEEGERGAERMANRRDGWLC